ncbi:winged helix-turn-helix transcriptional regulator [Nocardia sp. NPDC005978]|uniref:winged helix-turn-helix transcriptional regulator n=1 Tax=Nocardia sp. NPDC005978 TaxID=3156725 RepID=UPI0033A5B3DB
MTRRSYSQYCGLSRSLDLVGERWTLLVVRELMSGPKRYTDLGAALPGIGTTLLATRVKQLEQDGIVTHRQLPPPAASQVYELTDVGHELARALVPLAMWGMRHQLEHTREPGETYRAEWTLVFLADLIDPSSIAGKYATYQFRIEDSTARLELRDGHATVTPGTPEPPADATLTTTLATIIDLTRGDLDIAAAVAGERITVDGNATAINLLVQALTPLTPG